MPGPLINSGKIVTVTYDSKFAGQQILNTFHFRTTLGTGTGIPLTDFYNQVNEKFAELVGIDFFYAGLFTPSVSNIKRRVQVIFPVRYMADVRPSNTTDGARPAAAANPPPSSTAILTFRTLVAVPRSLSNIHIAVTDISDVDSGIVQASLRDPMVAFANQINPEFTLTFGGSTVKMKLVIPKVDDLAASQDADAFAVQPYSRVLRRRGVQLGS